MRTLARCALSIAAEAALLAGCGALPLSPWKGQYDMQPGARVAHRLAPTSSYSVLYRFRGKDSAYPLAGLINIHGTLYGTTQGGTRRFGHHNGTVFSVTTAGTAKLLHSFGGAPDGAKPQADMINVKGTLYGTTALGGSGCGGGRSIGCGTVFSITRTGTEKVLYSFGGASDGAVPFAGLIYVKGTLYGTTATGGGSGSRGGCTNLGCGTVFSVTTSGTEQVLYSFGGGRDGSDPQASLINVNGTLYGTTFTGGSPFNSGEGTVFKVTTNGTEKVLHCFCGGGTGDGAFPAAGLIDVNGTLYGTTEYGGDSSMCASGCGTVFSVTTAGKEKILYRFSGRFDGALPTSGLINVNGVLYGTTTVGGANGYGAVFSITTTGKEKVLYSFGGGSDGAQPWASLINVTGTLYGTTYNGGGLGCLRHLGLGCGTVFALKP